MRTYSVLYEKDDTRTDVAGFEAKDDDDCRKQFEEKIGGWDNRVIEFISLNFYMTNEDEVTCDTERTTISKI